MHLSDCSRLLDPAPMPLEMGYERLDDGVLHVAIRTDMHRCTGAMFEWWFGFRPETREYIWWHPNDHIASTWAETQEGTHVGSIHHATERFTGSKPVQLAIQFRDPHEFFDAEALAAARDADAVSGLICAHGGEGPEPRRRPDGTVMGTRLIHLCRDTPWGLALRTHFFLGYDLPRMGAPKAVVEEMFPDQSAAPLLQHCYDEFTTLAQFLPSIYQAERRNELPPVRPW